MASIYSSKIDAWLVAVLAPAVSVSLYACWYVASMDGSAKWIVLLPTAALGVCLPLWLLMATRYTLDSAKLLVQSGPFRWAIPLREIRSAMPTRNPLASPALSLDRLRIEYGSGSVILISPREKEAFLHDLEARRAGAV